MSGNFTDYFGDGSSDDASLSINADGSYSVPRTSDTATTNAIQSMQPVTSTGAVSDSGWSAFWQQTLGGVIQTATKVAAVKNGVQPVQGQYYVAPKNNNGLLLVAGAVVVVLLLTHKG